MKNLAVVILAAGEGTRMKSSLPKVLHKLASKSLVKWVLDSSLSFKPEKVCVVVGYGADKIKEELRGQKVSFALQTRQLGSGHALNQAAKYLKNYKGDVLVLCGDVPLVRPETLKRLIEIHRKKGNSATILSSVVENPFSYGRIYRDKSGQVKAIVEEKDATDEIRKINEINSGIYVFSSPLLWNVLNKIKPNNKKNEYYLTDAVTILNDMGKICDACPEAGFEETLGINTRVELATAEGFVRKATLKKIMLSGVSIVDPDTTYIASDIVIGNDTVIYPCTVIEGRSKIGAKCKIGPFTVIKDAAIADDVQIVNSHVYESTIAENVKIGPFSHIRPGTIIKKGAHIGNFSETKKSVIGEGSKVNHLSYIGDTDMGSGVNIGAGTITCNYDGVNKHKTIIGDKAFVGSNTNFVAPVKIGREVLIAAGSTITEDIPDGMLALARARQVNKKRKIR